MKACTNPGDFKKFFLENMSDLGLGVPTSLFDTYQTAVANAAAMAGALHLLGKGATVAELVFATVAVEKFAVALSFGAAGYTGAVIGSIAVASGRVLGCGTRLADVIAFSHQTQTTFVGQEKFFAHNTVIFDIGNRNRAYFGQVLKMNPASFEYA